MNWKIRVYDPALPQHAKVLSVEAGDYENACLKACDILAACQPDGKLANGLRCENANLTASPATAN